MIDPVRSYFFREYVSYCTAPLKLSTLRKLWVAAGVKALAYHCKFARVPRTRETWAEKQGRIID